MILPLFAGLLLIITEYPTPNIMRPIPMKTMTLVNASSMAPMLYLTTMGTMSTATRQMTLTSGFSAGPAVSFSGSPTVSPTILAL